MDHRLQYYRGRGAARLSFALASYIFATTILITSAVVLVPAAFIFSAREFGVMGDGTTIWSCSLPLTMDTAIAFAIALLLSHEASEMGCESRLLTEIFNTLTGEDSFEKEPRGWRRARCLAPYLGVLSGVPAACLAAYVLVWVMP
jgi:hypothetical protein